jgi:hypothetical protein
MSMRDTDVVMRIGIVRADLGSPFKQRGRIGESALLATDGAEGNQRIEVSWCLAEQPLQQPIGAVGLTQLQGRKGLTESRGSLVAH